ncbi:hypothetical protein [Limnohabitans sp.]
MQDYEQYITVQEAAARLHRPEPEICRMLETGALPAMLRAELWSNDGTFIKFDFALLPPEGVARVFDQGGDDFKLEWKYCGGHGEAICEGARQSSIRVLWEPSLFPELMPQFEDDAQVGTSADAASVQPPPDTPATTTASEPAPSTGIPGKRRAKKLSIESVALTYLVKEYKTNQGTSAAKFHKHLCKTAGTDGSPFEMGTGGNSRKLFCPAARSFFEVGTLGNLMPKIRP